MILSLLAALLLVVNALAQAGERQTSINSPGGEEISAARSQYLQSEAASHDADAGTNDAETLAQLGRRGPVRRYPGRPRYSGPGAPRMWAGPGDGHRAAIGALIGLGLGVAMGAKVNSDNHAGAQIGAPLIFGGLGAMLGAVAGGSIRPLHSRNTHRPVGPEEDQVASKSSAVHTREWAAVRPTIPSADNFPELTGAP